MAIPQITLKVLVLGHFILTVWATMNPFLGICYVYMNLFVLSLGVWSIVHQETADSVLMFMVCHIFSILQDMILLGLCEPRAYRKFEHDNVPGDEKNEYRFSLGMSILNLIIKPITAFLLYRIYRERGGSYTEFNIPSVGNLPGFGGGQGGSYENIDEPVSGNNPHSEHPYHARNENPYAEEKPPLH